MNFVPKYCMHHKLFIYIYFYFRIKKNMRGSDEK